MKKLILALLLLGNITALYAAEGATTGESVGCKEGDQECCDRVVSANSPGAKVVPEVKATPAADAATEIK